MPINYYQLCCARGAGGNSTNFIACDSAPPVRRDPVEIIIDRYADDSATDTRLPANAADPKAPRSDPRASGRRLARTSGRRQRRRRRFEEIELKCYSLTDGAALLDANHDYRLLLRNSPQPPPTPPPDPDPDPEPAATPTGKPALELSLELSASRRLLDVRPAAVSLVRYELDPASGKLGDPLEPPRPVACDNLCDSFELVEAPPPPPPPAPLPLGPPAPPDERASLIGAGASSAGRQVRRASKLMRRLNRLLAYVRLAPKAPKTRGPKPKKQRAQPSREFPIMISYQRHEGQAYALALRAALARLGVGAYVDVLEIQSGSDWQDSLNEAILACRTFVALVTPSYGETLWTSREVKLADVLGKQIIPVNFGQVWPPPALAIQFATLQYVFWLEPNVCNPNEQPRMCSFEMGANCEWRPMPAEDSDEELAGARQSASKSPQLERPSSAAPRMPKWPSDCVASVAWKILLSMRNYSLEFGSDATNNGIGTSAGSEAQAPASRRRALAAVGVEGKWRRADSGYDSSSAQHDEPVAPAVAGRSCTPSDAERLVASNNQQRDIATDYRLLGAIELTDDDTCECDSRRAPTAGARHYGACDSSPSNAPNDSDDSPTGSGANQPSSRWRRKLEAGAEFRLRRPAARQSAQGASGGGAKLVGASLAPAAAVTS